MPFMENSSLLFSSIRLELVISENSQFFACKFWLRAFARNFYWSQRYTYKLHLFLGEFVYSLCEAMAKAAESAVAAAASEACIGGGGWSLLICCNCNFCWGGKFGGIGSPGATITTDLTGLKKRQKFNQYMYIVLPNQNCFWNIILR